MGLCGKVLVAGDGFCEKLLATSPCPIQLIPEDSKTDPLLAKAKPISDGGSTSVITCLGRGKNCCARAVKKEE